MCHESSGLGLTETIGIGKSTVKIEDFALRRQHLRHRAEPGHLSPAHADRAAEGGEERLQDRQRQPAARDRDDPLQEPAGAARRCSGTGTPIACLFLPVRINGDVALFKGIMKEMLEKDRAAGGKLLAHDFIAHHTEGFDALVRDLDATSLGRDRRRRAASRASRSRRRASIALASERMICCWAMGITQHSNGVANVQEHRELRAAARADRAPRRRPLSGARAQQRAGRSHRRHLGEDEPGVPERAGQGVQVLAARGARPRHRQDDRGDARGKGEGVRRRWAATSCPRRPTRTTRRRRSRAAG